MKGKRKMVMQVERDRVIGVVRNFKSEQEYKRYRKSIHEKATRGMVEVIYKDML